MRPAVHFEWGFLNPESAKTLLSKMLSEDLSALYGHWTMLTPGSSPERVGTRMLTGAMEVLNLAARSWTEGIGKNRDGKRTQPMQQLNYGEANDGEILGHSLALSDHPRIPKTWV